MTRTTYCSSSSCNLAMRSRRFWIRSISWSANLCCASQCRRKPTTASRLSLACRSARPISARIICRASASSTRSKVFASAAKLSSTSYNVSAVCCAGIRSVAILLFSFPDISAPLDFLRGYVGNSDRAVCRRGLLGPLDRLEQFFGAQPRRLAALKLAGVLDAVPLEDLPESGFTLGSGCLRHRVFQPPKLLNHAPWRTHPFPDRY